MQFIPIILQEKSETDDTGKETKLQTQASR